MTRSPSVAHSAPPAAGHVPDFRTGYLIAGLILALFGGGALALDVPRAVMGFKSDEATYYMMAHSLARDGDLTYHKHDLARVWHEFPSGPLGVFLKKGRTVDLSRSDSFPFIRIDTARDPDGRRLYYGKAYIYPVFAAPFVWLAGTNGMLLFHAVLLALGTLAAYLFLNARSPAAVSALIATAFFFAAVPAGYYVWMTPELFNLVVVMLGVFCWLYKEVAPAALPRGLGWLRTGKSDVVAVALLAVATFSKPSNVLLIAPLLVWWALRRRWAKAIAGGFVFGAMVAALFAINVAITGDWNFQGGERNTYYRDFPLLEHYRFSPAERHATDRLLSEVIFDPEVFWSRLGHNLVYFFVGRHSGMVPYFFPGFFALVAFLVRWRHSLSWQWLVLGAAIAEILVVLIWIPHNYFGGAGVLGSRYFMNTYGLFLFLLPPLGSIGTAAIPWIVGALFTAPITLNPFHASFRPYEFVKHGPLRWLPVELTLVNDLPINTAVHRVRVLFGTNPRFQIYFLDDNAYEREGESFWIRGDSRADMLFKTPRRVSRLRLGLSAGVFGVTVHVDAGDAEETVQLAPGETRTIELPLDEGFPYRPQGPSTGTLVWPVSIGVEGGFIPMFDGTNNDHRFLGVRVIPELIP
ncbi:MAG TPA: hypothetical protein VNK41_04560 [Vicinamibacterales bacterium]|nr:hypothetical protein [Vicinamibacterales bacterium]